MKRRFFPILFSCLTMLLMAPLTAMAQEEENYYDARIEGYPMNVTLESSSTALTWLLFIFLSAVCIAVMFKNAKRTHLD